MTVKLRPMVAAKHNCEVFRLIAKCGTINADSEWAMLDNASWSIDEQIWSKECMRIKQMFQHLPIFWVNSSNSEYYQKHLWTLVQPRHNLSSQEQILVQPPHNLSSSWEPPHILSEFKQLRILPENTGILSQPPITGVDSTTEHNRHCTSTRTICVCCLTIEQKNWCKGKLHRNVDI